MIRFFSPWFPGAVHQRTPFGWDPGPSEAEIRKMPPTQQALVRKNWPRGHLAGDWATRNGRRLIDQPRAIVKGTVEWLPKVGSSSVLRLISYEVELNYYHHRREELSSDVIAALETGAEIEAGTPIGPVGNVGLSVPGKGNDGEHEHLVMKFRPDMTEELGALLGEGWNETKLPEFSERYGTAFDAMVKEKRIVWMTDVALLRFDPLAQDYRIFVDPAKILGE